MLRIGGLDWLESLLDGVEHVARPFLPKAVFYRYAFICRGT
jgi:hypothetical protein